MEISDSLDGQLHVMKKVVFFYMHLADKQKDNSAS